MGETLFDASKDVHSNGSRILLPFDLNQTVNNLRYERYVNPAGPLRWVERPWVRETYYRFRPMLPVSLRKHLQAIYLKDWDKIAFPSWPVDRSVDMLFEKLLLLLMKALGKDSLPFIWFWPDGYKACAVMTHDVETTAGRDFCGRVMDIDDEFGLKASFQVVPEKRYTVPASYLRSMQERGFEINVQGLDHDGNLFQNRARFLESARKINEYGKQYGARGFRSPILYRNADWFQDLEFSYDMSMPNVARLEAQRGGCCTIMPYFLPGGVLELPVTMTEDYTLFHILNDHSMSLWQRQMAAVLNGNGFMNFIIHPDYVMNNRAESTFRTLLENIVQHRSERKLWTPLPRDVDEWWRLRSQMRLVGERGNWTVEGRGCERARVAMACIDGDRLAYEIAGERNSSGPAISMLRASPPF